MVITIDRDLLVRLGLGRLPTVEADDLLVFIHEVLLRRVRDVIAPRLTGDQLDALDQAVDQSSWLDQHVSDYAEVVQSEFDRLCAEVSSERQGILTGRRVRVVPSDDIEWPHGRPGPGPLLVGGAAGECLVPSPFGHVVVAVNAERDELYARRGDNPSVLLQMPEAHQVDVTSICCTDDGEVRVRFSDALDLRWHIAARATGLMRPYAKVPIRRRPDLQWTEIPVADEGFVEFACGRWHIRDAQNIEVTDIESRKRVTLEQLHDKAHSNAVNPHFTPDNSQLVAVYNARDDRTQGGVKACSSRYLETAEGDDDPDDEDGEDAERPPTPWQYEVHTYGGPDGPERTRAGGDQELTIEGVGYDQFSTRAAVLDGRSVHLYELPQWSVVRTIPRADRTARAARVDLPRGDSPPQPCWAGHSVVVAAGDGTVWRLDLRHDDDPQPVPPATRDKEPVAVISSFESAVLVYPDREVVTIDGAGKVETQTLRGAGVILAADATADGQLLVSTGPLLELWSTGSARDLMCTTEITGAAVVGVSAAPHAPELAILWHSDLSVTTARLSLRHIHLTHGSLPYQTSKPGFTPAAVGGALVDVDRWYLIQPTPADDEPGRTRVARPTHWVDIPARCLSYMRGAQLIAAGTDDGVSFISAPAHPADRPLLAMPLPIDLPGPVTSVAAGSCPRSLAVATRDTLWMVRLLV